MRYEVWSYSKSWGKWVRNVYPQLDDAQKHFDRLRRLGRRVHPPQPVNTGLPWADKLRVLLNRLLKRKLRQARLGGHTRIGTRVKKESRNPPTVPANR